MKKRIATKTNLYITIFLGFLIFVGLYVISTYDYLLFHSLAEVFSIVIAIGIFAIAIKSRKFINNDYLLFIGIAYLFIAGIDSVHTLAYKGMNIFTGFDTNLSVQLWIAARYLQAITLLIAPFFIIRRLNVKINVIVYFLITGTLLTSIFLRFFPVAYIEGFGLTQFKIISEYIISLFLISSIFFLLKYKKKFTKSVFYLLIGSIIVTVFAELAFTFYINVYGLSNLIGHFFKIIAFYLIYRAIIQANLMKVKIKSLLLAGFGISIILVLLFSLMVYVGFNKIAVENERELIAHEIHKSISELDIITYEYIAYRGERMLQQWDLRYDSVMKIIEKVEGEEWEVIKSNYDDLKALFSQIVENYLRQGSSELNERLITQFLIKSQAIISSTSLIAEGAYNNAISAQKTANNSMMIALIVLFVSLLGISLYIAERIAKPLGKLAKGAEIIGKGKLKYKIDIKSRDEIGELADAFNKMTRDLALITASRDDLNIEIKERRQAEQELRKSYESLKELDRLKDQFLNTTTHELKTPLIPIKSQAQLLLAGDYGGLNKEQKKAIEMIHRNENHMEKLVTEVLDIAKVRSKELDLVLEKVSLGQIITAAVKNVEEKAKEKHIKLILNPMPGLPDIFIDERRMSEVIANLLLNTFKFTPENGMVEINVSKEKKCVVVSIKDNGIGINKKNLKKIFTPFFQVDKGLGRKYGGTGLGLAICNGVIKAHGGKIWVESEGEGKGSTFTFSLPIKRADKIKK